MQILVPNKRVRALDRLLCWLLGHHALPFGDWFGQCRRCKGIGKC